MQASQATGHDHIWPSLFRGSYGGCRKLFKSWGVVLKVEVGPVGTYELFGIRVSHSLQPKDHTSL